MIKTGDKLWLVRTYGRDNGQEVTVSKAGRVWADIGLRGARLNLKTMRVSDTSGCSNSVCYMSESDYLDERKREHISSMLAHAISGIGTSKTFTTDQLLSAAKALGIELPA